MNKTTTHYDYDGNETDGYTVTKTIENNYTGNWTRYKHYFNNAWQYQNTSKDTETDIIGLNIDRKDEAVKDAINTLKPYDHTENDLVLLFKNNS